MNRTPSTQSRTAVSQKTENTAPSFRVIPLGGMEEIGKNFTIIECEDDLIIIDCGIKFPDDEMYGIDFVIPDFSYLDNKLNRIRGLFLTHGHEDHIGAIPYFIKRFGNIPIYGTKLTIGLLQNKIAEHKLESETNLNNVNYGSVVTVKGFMVEFVMTNHSIPDSASLLIKCAGGTIFHTGDFKVDLTPVDDQRIDLARIAEAGTSGIDLLISDSTNAEKPGHTASEKTIGVVFEQLFTQAAKKRIIVASFSTNIHRIQQIFDAARAHRRKVAVIGRSMVNVVKVAKEMKYLRFKDSILIDVSDISQFPSEQLVLLTTGSQGEPMSALSRMASGEHRQAKINGNDFVIISASPIPGNEKTVAFVISDLIKQGAEVIYQGATDVHVSGHGSQNDLELILALTRPRCFVPCHGEYKMLYAHAEIAKQLGVKAENINIMQNGQVLEITEEGSAIVEQLNVGITLVDGSGIGDIGSIVLRDRKKLSEGGLFVISATIDSEKIIAGPSILSRGFIYMRGSADLLKEAKQISRDIILNKLAEHASLQDIKSNLKSSMDTYLFGKTMRKPVVMPIIMKAE
ncbi:MAG: ribonuclease J [Eubacteriaceae bacterium]|nr:ribonuclease J [Eubacteriaceae bacterium]